jgi:predicted peptidase
LDWKNKIAFLTIIVLASCASPEPQTLATLEPDFIQLSASENIAPSNESSLQFISSAGDEISFLVYFPENYSPEAQWPAILFLHGSDASGSDIERVAQRSPQVWRDPNQPFPFIVISPQLPRGTWDQYFVELDELLLHLKGELPILDPGLFISGYSIGATGAWQYALQYPAQFTGLVPVAGGPTTSRLAPVPDDICTLSSMPIMIFHGDSDTAVPIENNLAAQSSLIDCDHDSIEFVQYAGVQHTATWPLAYAEQTLYEWMLSLLTNK